MPNINLRLTEEEHEQLRVWAFEGRRSIQKEIVFRLFSDSGEILRNVRYVPSPLPPPPDLTVGAVDDVTEPMTEYLHSGPTFPGGRSKGGPDFVKKRK